MFASRTLSVSIDMPPAEVYGFVSDPGHLPRWARAFCRSVRRSNGDWLVETPQGPVKLRFTERNGYGILDHYVTPAAGVEIYIPMRVVANGSGSEVIFTLFRQPDMTDEQFAEDAALVERDLETLKNILEGGWEGSASSGRAD